MLWWLIIWLASGLVVPALLLLAMAHRWLAPSFAGLRGRLPSPRPSPRAKRYMLAGAVGISALALVYAGMRNSFSTAIQTVEPPATLAQVPAKLVPANAEGAQAATPVPADLLPVVPSSVELAPGQKDGATNGGAPTESASLPPPIEVAPLPVPVNLKEPADLKESEMRGTGHRRVVRPAIIPARTTRGVWLFPPHLNGGGAG
jgi:hypothetical protein